MNTSVFHMTGAFRRLRAAVLVALALALIAPLASRPVEARHRETLPDLAAMVLTAPDLAAEGLEGHGGGLGELLTVDQLVATRPEEEQDEFRAAYEEFGLIASYTVSLSRPVGDSRQDNLTVAAGSYISLFETEEGAAAFFELLEEDDEEPGVDVRGVETIGDESELTRQEGDEADLLPEHHSRFGSNDLAVSQDLTIRVGQVYAGIRIIDVAREGEDLDEQSVGTMEDLGERLVERIEAGLDGDWPGLSTRIVRLGQPGEDQPVVETDADRYQALDGAWLGDYGDDAAVVEAVTEVMGDQGVVDIFRIDQDVQIGRPSNDADLVFLVELTRFEDEELAEEFFDGAIEWWTAVDWLVDIEEVDDAAEIGDESVTLAFDAVYRGVDYSGYAMIVRVGDVLAVIDASTPDGVGLEAVVELAGEQVECLEDRGCAGPLEVPEGLIE